MKRREFGLSLLTVSSVLFSGCNFGNVDESKTEETQPTAERQESNSATPERTDTETADSASTFDAKTNTDSIVLRLSDLPDTFEYSGEKDIVAAELDEAEREQYTSKDIVRQHSRSFRQASESDGPMLVYSEATVYENADHADAQLTDTESTFQEKSASIDTVELAADVTATQIQYENDRGIWNVLLYYQRGNMQLLMIVSGSDDFYPDLAEELIIAMVSDV
jgi:hypothetical protein